MRSKLFPVVVACLTIGAAVYAMTVKVSSLQPKVDDSNKGPASDKEPLQTDDRSGVANSNEAVAPIDISIEHIRSIQDADKSSSRPVVPSLESEHQVPGTFSTVEPDLEKK